MFEPVQGASFIADYFNIKVKDLIIAGFSSETILGDLDTYGYLVQRGPVDPGYPTLPGPITQILQTNMNLGEVKIEGIDLEMHLRSQPTNVGRFNFDATGTYFIKYDTQQPDGAYAGGVSTVYGQVVTGVIPRWKHYATLSWLYGPWTVGLSNLYQSDYIDQQVDNDGNQRRVSSMSLWDLQASYTGIKNLRLTLGWGRWDRRGSSAGTRTPRRPPGEKTRGPPTPPVTNQQYTFQSGFDPSYYDARARFIYGSVNWKFL